MTKNIFDRHAQEWEEYFQAYDQSRNRLEADEVLIRKHFGLNDKDLPADLRDMIDRNRQAWVNEWGAKGTKRQGISERHSNEIKADYETRFPEAVPVQPEHEADMPDIPPYTEAEMDKQFAEQRDVAQEQLKGELNAIDDAYKHSAEPVPNATQKRMARRVMAFKQEWYGIDPETPLKDSKVLNDKDHQNHFQSFRDLARSHNIIEAHYGAPENVPESTRKEFAREMEEYHSEIDDYQATRKHRQEQFKARLNNLREQQPTLTHRRR